MSISRLLLGTVLCALLSSVAWNAQAADVGAIKVKSIAETEVEVVNKDGKKEIKRTAVDKAIPGTEVIFTNVFENVSKQAATDIVINNPIPNDMEYRGGSAAGKDCVILFSIDGGTKFDSAENLKVKAEDGKERVALPKEYTNIRWTYKGQLAAGKSGEVSFRATIK
ncbi:MAG: hypothetical protein ACOY3V_05090 [Pseudomonadota bacterium]